MFARFFVDRPIFATVISIVIIIVGLVSLMALPVAQYPEVTPPTISVTAVYPGANAKVVADTVAAPIEQEVNGVENMLYMSSKCTNDGQMSLDVTFKLGTNIDSAQVLTQNRVTIAESKLPDEVKRQGVTVKKRSPSILLCVNLLSGDGRYDQLYLSNYATLQIKDALARLEGVGDVMFLGARDYSMRIWLDPLKLASRSMTASDVIQALREQNVQVAAGRIGQPPTPAGQELQLAINTTGRLLEPEQFADVIIKTGDQGEVVRVRDVGRTELGAKNYDVSSYLDGQPSVTLAVFQMPGSNALATADAVRAEMDRLKKYFPQGVEYKIVYDTTVFVEESVHEVYKTLFEAFVLVFLVVLLFLQDWRATMLPMIDVPVSLIGTFAVMAVMGFSLNNLSLFGLVLAIGIVVDDAIVVVENIERWVAKGLAPREATIKAMDEITGPVIAITLVLSSVFIPTAFIAGISGQFYRQFALTIAAATIISAINALTMAPARAVAIFKPHQEGHEQADREALPPWGLAVIFGLLGLWQLVPIVVSTFGLSVNEPAAGAATAPWAIWAVRGAVFLLAGVVGWMLYRPINKVLNVLFRAFNRAFDWLSRVYGTVVGRLLRVCLVVLVVYGGLMGLTYLGFSSVPVGFIPEQDKGYLVVNAMLPDGASLERTEAVLARVNTIVKDTPGVAHVIAVPGYNTLNSTNLSNAGGMFVLLAPFEERKHDRALHAGRIVDKLRASLRSIQDAEIVVFGAPPVEGLGSTGGFKMQIQDRGGSGSAALEGAVQSVLRTASGQPGLAGLFTSFRASQPQLFVDIDRTKAKRMGVSLDEINQTLQVYLGSAYANDFTQFDRNWQVNVQADARFRLRPEDIGKLQVRNVGGQMVPLATLIAVRDVTGPAIINRYNMYPSAEILGGTRPGFSSGQAIQVMEAVAGKELPGSMGFEWTELTLLEILAGNTAVFVFALGTLFVFMVLAAQYESWSLPLAIVLIVPMCLLAAILGVWMSGMENNIFTQIGLVVLIGLAAKNAILIVEFAKERQTAGLSSFEAAIDACRTRLRPIIMTSLAFILGVVPLVLGTGAGAEMRNALGIAVLSGMLGVTLFGLFFTPVFYYLIMWFGGGRTTKAIPAHKTAVEEP
jgi:multidrug efflux pump